MIETIEAQRCTCQQCGAVWVSEGVPQRCARCKSRKWNAGGVAVAESIKPPVVLAKSKSWTRPEKKQSRKAAAIAEAVLDASSPGIAPSVGKVSAVSRGCGECGAVFGHQKGCSKR